MLVISKKNQPETKETRMDVSTKSIDTQSALVNDSDFLKEIVKRFLQNTLEEEFIDHIGASRFERSRERQGYRNGHYGRQLKTRVGCIELLVPRDREGIFRTELFERYQRSEKALVLTLAEMYFRGISTRKVSAVVEELCGHGVSKSHISDLAKLLDKDLKEWRTRSLEGIYAYLQLDAIYQKVREGGCVASVATFVAVGVGTDGKREVLGCHVATSEYKTEWKQFLRSLKKRGINIPKLVVSDDHDGLREAIAEELTGTLWQRCQVHHMRNFLGRLSKKHAAEMVPLLREVYQGDDLEAATEAKKKLVDCLQKRGLEDTVDWIEETIDDTLNILNIPEGHRKRMRSTNMVERLNEEIRRRTRVIRIFPNRASCTRIITSVCQEASEAWEERRYLNFEGLE